MPPLAQSSLYAKKLANTKLLLQHLESFFLHRYHYTVYPVHCISKFDSLIETRNEVLILFDVTKS